MKIPYGIHDYKTIKTKGYLFVDKTEFIKKIESIGEYLVFLRPRRFGKSLFSSMFNYYYDIKYKDEFGTLFKDTYIGSNKTEEANSYYTLKFDFSGINTERDIIEEEFYDCVRDYLQSFINYYKLDISLNQDTKKASNVLRNFLLSFKSLSDKQIYIIIDEYDHFANNVMTSDLELFNEITGKDGFVRGFYEVFKTYAGTTIGRMFITGVTPITLDSLTSGFNMAKNVGRHPTLNEMMGFTEEEVTKIFDIYNTDYEHLRVLKENYNGYSFNKNSKIKVYNSNMVLYYMDSMYNIGDPPDNLVDPNIISDYTKVTRIFDLYNDDKDKEVIINDILTSTPIITTITDTFNIKMTFNKDDFLSLLYYLGLLTVESSAGTDTALCTPNYVIKTVYFEYFYYYLKDSINFKLDVRHIKDAIIELVLHNKIDNFIILIERFLKELSNRDYISFDEKYVKLLMITYFRLSNMYLVKSEYETEGIYPDISLLPNYVYNAPNYFIFELKYLSKKDATEEKINIKKQEAIDQIKSYANTNEFKNIANLKKYVIFTVQDECRVVEEV